MWPNTSLLSYFLSRAEAASKDKQVQAMLDRFRNSPMADSVAQAAGFKPQVTAQPHGGMSWFDRYITGPMYGYDQGMDPSAVVHGGNRVVFNTEHLANAPVPTLNETYFHEMGHIAETHSPDMYKAWQEAAYGRKGTGYAATNETERFAEAFQAAIEAMRYRRGVYGIDPGFVRRSALHQEQDTPGVMTLMRLIGSKPPYNNAPVAQVYLRNSAQPRGGP